MLEHKTVELSPTHEPVLRTIFRSPELTTETFDATVIDDSTQLKIVYVWGHDCPNCVLAKDNMKAMSNELSQLPVTFLAINAYHHMDIATRFGLFGIPVFLFFKRGRLIGKITSFPTQEEFLAAIRRTM